MAGEGTCIAGGGGGEAWLGGMHDKGCMPGGHASSGAGGKFLKNSTEAGNFV